MKLSIFDTYEHLSRFSAEQILETIKSNPRCTLCLATGDSPKLTYQLLVKALIDQKTNVGAVHFVALDEWMGVPPSNPGSCHYFLHENVFAPLQIKSQNVHLFDAFAKDLFKECRKMDEAITRLGGIDLMLVGVGMNGHVGFNEPGASETLYAHIADLDSTTQQVGQKYFSQQTALVKGMTLGLAQFFEAKKVLMLANGKKKSAIIKNALEGNISMLIPASMIRKHKNSQVLIDQEAASELTSTTKS
ncbi:MAG TPA: glucosamine-6-phosphate deaminase [Cyclobacteriaceae bacterium]|nr:glucosamine-6-phosphate deaminase [Cyclobacteriaceae bacterium]